MLESHRDRTRRAALVLAMTAVSLAVVTTLRRIPDGRRGAGVLAVARDASRPLHLDGASVEELALLPTVGRGTARAIAGFREHVRRYGEVRDLSLIPGISENRFHQLSPYVEVVRPMNLIEARRALLASADVESLLRLALAEDVGSGDVTTRLTVPDGARAEARLHCRDDAVICGAAVLERCLEIAGADLELEMVAEGTHVEAGAVIGTLRGDARDLVTLERVLLNLLQRMSGIATRTRAYVEAAGDADVVILETRKTVPGWRRLDKYAVLAGGGSNHRMGLYDGILIKENHVALAAGNLATTLSRVLDGRPAGMHVQIEVETLDQLDVALAAGVDSVLLDNMTDEEMREAVRRAQAASPRRPLLEASGGITLERIASVAATGVDRISVGALTHGVPAVDVSLLVD